MHFVSIDCNRLISALIFLKVQVVDGPDDDGNMFERPGKVSLLFYFRFGNQVFG